VEGSAVTSSTRFSISALIWRAREEGVETFPSTI